MTKVTPNTVFMDITPEKALNWLENANANNRKIVDAHVHRLAREMKNGRWNVSHQGIAFSTNGVLLDGQHRLWAIVESQMTITMPVTFNVSPEARMVIDEIETRSKADIIRLAGGNGAINSNHLAALRGMLGGFKAAPKMTTQELSEQLTIYGQAIRFAIKHLPCGYAKGICNATTRAVIARAWYSVSHDRLVTFCEMLTRGIIPPSPTAATLVTLREHLLTATGHSLSERRETYGKMQRALIAYLNNEPLQKLLASTREHFSIPGERQLKGLA